MKDILKTRKGTINMKRSIFIRLSVVAATIVGAIGLSVVPVAAIAARPGVSTAAKTSDSTNTAKLQLIINRGNNEISRRLTTLNTLSNKINSAAKLSAADKNTLTAEVSAEVSNLTSLKTKLDAETTVASAQADAQSVITGYRVYALIVPKVNLVKVADDQQVAESKLNDLAGKLQQRITTAKNNGKKVTSLQSSLDDLTKNVSAAQTISSTIESNVIGLQPSDYNSNHNVLSGYRNQLKTAQHDVQAAASDAKSIVAGLKNL